MIEMEKEFLKGVTQEGWERQTWGENINRYRRTEAVFLMSHTHTRTHIHISHG